MKAITDYIVPALIFSSLTLTSVSNAQVMKTGGGWGIPPYITAIGLRGGNEGGISIKRFIKNETALEGMMTSSFSYGGFKLSGFYEKQKTFTGSKKLDFFYGIGAHAGIYDGNYYGQRTYADGYYDKKGEFYSANFIHNYPTLGIDGIVGLEYRFSRIPFTLGLDVKPYVDLIGWGSGHYADAAFSLRYILNAGPKPQ